MAYTYLDLETHSELDIKKVSLDTYANHPSTRILMIAYAGDTGPVDLWEEADGLEALAPILQRMKTDTCIAHNVSFERNLVRACWQLTNIKWLDNMVASLYAGFPAGLKDVVKLPFFNQEAESTKETLLINKFCKPQRDGSARNRETDPEDWAAFCDYCKRDVQGTRVVWQWIQEHVPTPESIWKQWEIDQAINERGMPIDRALTERAWTEAQRLQLRENDRLKDLTGLDNPNSNVQLLGWLRERGYPYTSLGKELVKKALKEEAEDVDNDD
jgi:DNA polymerase bacteriophage-type